MTLGTQIKKYRLARNLTQLQVAEMLNLTKGAVTSWEKDRQNPTVQNILKLSEILGVQVSDIIYRTGEISEAIRIASNKKPAEPLKPPQITLTPEHLESIPIFNHAKGNIDDRGYIIEVPIGKIARTIALSNHNDL